MQKASEKQHLHEVPPTHEALFVENYDQLKQWALRFTKHDDELADDLLHDAFIHFTLTKPDLSSVENLDAYLYVIMRNLHLSQLRRAARTRPSSVVDFDMVDVTLWGCDPRSLIRVRDDLFAVCQYACDRKETSKVGSVLILRFFHGYYPEEIAAIIKTTRASADTRLCLARSEAKLYLEDPTKLAFINTKTPKKARRRTTSQGELRQALRRQIFDAQIGTCLTADEIQKTYAADSKTKITTQCLAHIVSCSTCIDIVNSTLDLPPLASRYSLDTIGKDSGPKGGSGGGGAGGSDMLDTFVYRREIYYHHEPQELSVAINGQPYSFQKVISGKGDFRLILDKSESLGFVEVFSEQGLRLLMLNVEPPPVGSGEQAAQVLLSNGRTLEANLDFSGPFPALTVWYNDPTIEGFAKSGIETTDMPNAESVEANSFSLPMLTSGMNEDGLLRKLFSQAFWLRPGVVASVLTLAITSALAIWFISQPIDVQRPNARTVLAQARDAELVMAIQPDNAIHRNYQVEEWRGDTLHRRTRVDQWTKKNAAAERTFDETGKMIAGAWTKPDGSRQIFEQGERLKTVTRTDPNATLDPVRDIVPTAVSFANFIDSYGVISRLALEESTSTYNLNYRDDDGIQSRKVNLPNKLLVASLTLDRNSLLPISETIVLRVGDETREYRFSDVRVVQKPLTEVSPFIFEPEAELSKGATKVTKPLEIDLPQLATSTNNAPASGTTATLDTEVEVFRALDSVNALSGDQITVTRTTSGQLKVSGIVDSSQRKTEILDALNALKNAPGVTIDVQTAVEAASRKKPSGTVQPIELDSAKTVSERQLPVEAELKTYFERRGAGESLNSQVNVYASAVLNRSDSLRRNALSLKQLAERFSPAELDRLDANKKEQWKALLRSKAVAMIGDVRSLQSQLSVVGLSVGGYVDGGGAAIRDASDLSGAAQRLFGLAAECDAQVQQSFTIAGVASAPSVKSVRFWRNLSQMSSIAAAIERAR